MLAQLSRELYLINLIRYIRLPYIWGGSGPTGYDCSGLVEAAHKLIGIVYPGRPNSQMLHDGYVNGNSPPITPELAGLGDLVFFGSGLSDITHVGLCLGYSLMLEAAHGDHTCTTPEIAAAKGAMVQVNPIRHRRDLVAILKMNIDWPPITAPSSAPV